MGFLRDQSYSPLNVEKRCIEEAIESVYHKSIRLRNLESDGILTYVYLTFVSQII